ncbi:MAG: hypothetical protein JHC93_03705 [Parachlamydiales bacterium]|nr:hypothetical protein [Parachlamydiales bacterium]
MCRIHLDPQFNHHNPIQNSILKITPENLSSVIDELGIRVFEIQIKEDFQVYTPLEYAVKNGDLTSVLFLLDLKKQCENPNFSEAGTIIHFYISLLKENTPPSLQVLAYLLQFIPEWNEVNPHTNRTPLEEAFVIMRMYSKVHWNVIKLLIVAEMSNGTSTKSNAFQVVNRLGHDDDFTLPQLEQAKRETRFLNNLCYFKDFEEFFKSKDLSFLEIDEYRIHSRQIYSHIFELIKVIREYKKFPERKPEEITNPTGHLKFIYARTQAELVENFAVVFFMQRWHFQSLVKTGEFKKCFNTEILNEIIDFLSQQKTELSIVLISSLKKWGLIKKNSANRAPEKLFFNSIKIA